MWLFHNDAGSTLYFYNQQGSVDGESWDWRGYVNNNGTVGARTDMRAPIYYDSSDTSYYTDPASISRVWGVAIRGDNSGTGTGNQIFFWGPGDSTTSAIGFKANGGAFPNPTGNGDGYNTYFTMDSNGRGWVFRRSNDGTFGNVYTAGWILNNGIAQFNDSTRSPIFYDSADTGYYVDPNSYSRLNRIVLNQARVDSSRYPIGHTDVGEAIFEFDPTWTNDQLQAYFNSSAVSWVADSSAPGGYAISIVGNVNVGGVYGSGFPYIAVDQDDVFYMEVWIKSVSGTNTHYMGSIDFDHNFSSLGGNPGSFGYWVMSNSNPGSSWTKYTGYIGGFGNSVGQFESGTKYWTPQALFNHTGGGTSYISGWKVIKVNVPGNRTFRGNVTAPIYYDSNQTYFGDFGSEIRMPYYNGGTMRLRTNTHWDSVSGIDAMGAAGEFRFSSDTGNLNVRTDGWLIAHDYVQSTGAMYATIYYDGNDSNYYADPNGLSVFSRLKLINNVNYNPRWDFTAYVVEAQHWYGNNSSMTMYLGESTGNNLQIVATPYANIYYDRQDSGYYLDFLPRKWTPY